MEFGRFGDSEYSSCHANTSHTFVPVWTDLTNTELQVLVDIGNDGTIDDTLIFSKSGNRNWRRSGFTA